MALISILIPAKNEEASIIGALEEIAKKVKVPYEVIVINDSSTDQTTKIVSKYLKKNKKVRLINTTKKITGFSNALHLGFTKSKGFAVVPVMGDLCDDPATINTMYKEMMEEDWDIVCGSRYIKGGKKSGGPKFQGILSRLVCSFLNSLGTPTSDITNAFKMYKRSVLEKLNFNPKSGVELSMELLLQAHFLQNAKIKDVPTVWRGRTSGESKFKFFERAPRYAKICLWALLNSLKRVKKVFILILAIAIVLRFLTVPNLLTFTPDEVYEAYFAQTLIKNFHIIWIGLSAGSFDLYLGPFWIYIIYPFLLIAKGDPLSVGFIAAFFGIFALIMLYLLAKKLFNQKTALVAILLYACLPLIIYYDQKPYPSAIPFISLLMAYSLYMTKKSNKWWVIFAIAYGFVFHIHLSLIPVGFVAVYWLFLRRKIINKKILIASAIAFLITVSPLIVFDYFHKGSNITTPIRILKASQASKPKTSSSSYHLDTLVNSLGRVWYLSSNKSNSDEILYPCSKTASSTFTKPPIIMSIISIIVVAVFVLKKNTWKNENTRLLTLLGFSFLAPFIILPIINPVEYYLLGFFPILFVITSLTLESMKFPFKQITYLGIAVILFSGIFTVVTAKKDYGMAVKKRLVQKVMAYIKESPYELYEEGDCHKYEGWRYIFSVYGKRPEKSSDDKDFAWLYPDELSQKDTKYKIIIKETRSNVEISQNFKFKFEEGGFTAYIFKNANKNN